jgi:hypothetical protein
MSHTSVLSPSHAHLKPHMKQESGAGASKYIYLHIHMRIHIVARSRTARSARGQHMIVLPSSARYRLAYVHHTGWAQCHAWREARSAGLTHVCFGDVLSHCTGFSHLSHDSSHVGVRNASDGILDVSSLSALRGVEWKGKG